MFVAIFSLYAMRMFHVVICGLSGYTGFFLPRYLLNGRIFEKKVTEHKYVFWFPLQILSEIFFVLRIIHRDIVINVHTGLHVKYPLLLSDFIKTWISPTDFFKNIQIPKVMRIILEGVDLFHADGQTGTDVTNLIIAFRYFTKAPNNYPLVPGSIWV